MGSVILFGAGVYAKKYKALLEYSQIEFNYFTDNDASKWGTYLYGKLVIPPKKLSEYKDARIVISCTHDEAIRKQLEDMGMGKNILEMEELYMLCRSNPGNNPVDVCETQKGQNSHESGSNLKYSRDVTLILDMYEGIGWGGTEMWAAQLALQLSYHQWQTVLIGSTQQQALETEYEKLVIRVSEEDVIGQMVDFMEQHMPFVLVNNFAGCCFLAAVLVKQRYPSMVRIISVIHNDNKALFDAHMLMKGYLDSVFCVSDQIRKHMQKYYDFPANQYYFREQPIHVSRYLVKKKEDTPVLRLAYAGRLVQQQKRVDLLPELIKLLEQKQLKYIFQIAGDGEYFQKLQDCIKKNGWDQKVQLLGHIPKSKMESFWVNQDVFVNISEYEGTSLSMLEAMSYACVPVVTDVSGAKEFIVPGENGYICDIGDMKKIADSIETIYRDRNKLKQFGMRCREIVCERCSIEGYIEYWEKNLLNA